VRRYIPLDTHNPHSGIGNVALPRDRRVLGKYFFRQVFGQKYYLMLIPSYKFGKVALTQIRFDGLPFVFCHTPFVVDSSEPYDAVGGCIFRVLKNLLLRRSAYDHTQISNRPCHLLPVPSSVGHPFSCLLDAIIPSYDSIR